MPTEPVRSREARRLAERALVRLLFELRDSPAQPIVLGGLVPDMLAGERARLPHLGTTDVDLLVQVGLDDLEALADVERALEAAGFEPDPSTRGGWRWRAYVEDVPVKVEFLCDHDDLPRENAISGGGRLGILNLPGTGYVALDYQVPSLHGRLGDGRSSQLLTGRNGAGGRPPSTCSIVRGAAML